MFGGGPRPAGFALSFVSLVLIALISPLLFVQAAAQTPVPAPQVSFEDQLRQADRLAADGRGTEARQLYLSVAERAHAQSRPEVEAQAFESFGRFLNGDSHYDEAQGILERALSLAESVPNPAAVARIQTSLGNVAVNRGRFKDADGWYRQAAATAAKAGEPRLEGIALLNIGLLDGTSAQERQQVHDRAADIAHSLGDADLEARVWHSRADREVAAGDLGRALEQLQMAARLYEQGGNKDGLASVYTSLGRVNRLHGLPLEAIPYYEKAFEIQRQSNDRIGMIQSLNATAVAYGVVGDYPKASAYYERAYALALESQSARAINFMRGNLAGGLLDLGENARGAELLETLLQDGGDSYPAVRHAQLARAYLAMGRLADARQHADIAVDLAKDTNQMLTALKRRAPVRRRQGDPEGALEDLQRAVGLIEQMRGKLAPQDFMKQGFTSLFLDFYTEIIGIFQERGQADRAIEVGESARARAFLDLLATRGILAPESAKPSDIRQLAAAAARGRSTIVSYWTSDDCVFIGVVPPTGPAQMVRVALPAKRLGSLVSSVAPPAAGSGVPGAHAASAAWKSLYSSLIDPIRKWLPPSGGHLTIIPHGPLMRLPFAALSSAGGRYLVEDYSISYVPAGAFLDAAAVGGTSASDAAGFLFVADPQMPAAPKGERPLPPLPGARDEVRSIARLVPSAQTKVLAGDKATKLAVTTAMPGAFVVHFATHGVVNDLAPLDSYLALAQSDPKAGDGRLTAQELYGLHLRARLVVLSSCQSAGGEVTGEGISALARAFLSAGAPSVVASVWDVPDKPANRLFPVLYEAWLQKRSPADALRAAQLRLIADLRSGRVLVSTVAGDVRLTESPVLWAGFVVIGAR